MEDNLTITIDYKTPLRADELGQLLNALARDYSKITRGRVLVVASIDHGSIIAVLKDWAYQGAPYIKDAVEIAKGAKALAEFGGILKDWIQSAKGKKRKSQPHRRRRDSQGYRSMEAIVRIAAENGRAIRIKHTSAEGEKLEAVLRAPEAKRVHQTMLTDSAKSGSNLIPTFASEIEGLPDLTKAVASLYAPTAKHLPPTEAEALIDILIDALNGVGAGYVLPQIAADLSSKGLDTLAAVLERKLRESERERLPPLKRT